MMTDTFFQGPMARREFLKRGALAAGSTALLTSLGEARPAPKTPPKTLKAHMEQHQSTQEWVSTLVAKDYSALLGQTPGLSEAQLKAHFKLYENYVAKTNQLQQAILVADDAMLSGSNAAYSAYRSLHSELSFNHNGVVLHELYFGNLGAKGEPSASLKALINRDFGSWEGYLKHLTAAGKAMRGWVLTGFDMRDGHLRLYGLDSHHQGSPIHVYPLLVLDVFEHAYFLDYATDRGTYLAAFMQNIRWSVVEERLLFAVHHLMSGPAATA